MINAFVTMLQGAGMTFATVDHSPSMEPIDDLAASSATLPALYILPGDESGGENARDIGVKQRVEKVVECLVICATTDRDTLTDELRAAAIGWAPDSSHDVMTYQGGTPIKIDGALMIWQETFSIDSWIST